MREFAKFPPQFWIGEEWRNIKQLGLEASIIAPYLLSSPHSTMIGIYYLPITLIAHELGLSFEGAKKGLQNLCRLSFCSYDEALEYVWVHEMAFSQLGAQLKVNDNRVKALSDAYHALPNLSYLSAFYAKYAKAFHLSNRENIISFIEAPCEPLASKEKEKEKEKEREKEKEKKKRLMSGKPDVDTLFLNDFVKQEQSVPKQSVSKKLALEHSAAKQSALKNTQALLTSEAIEVLTFLNKKTGRAYRPIDANLKLIIARLKTGATIADCHQVIAKKNREWRDNPKMAEYLRPATLFNATKFEQYMGELILPEGEQHESH